MEGNKRVRVAAFLLLLFWMIVIFTMSAQPANESSQTSSKFVSKVIDVIYSDFEGFSVEKQTNITHSITFIVRKTAHFLEYFILGALAAITAFTFKKNSIYPKMLASALFSALYAVSDEVHQYFVPGRACRILDIGIDFAGSICAIVLMTIIILVAKRHKSGGFNAKKEID